MPFTPEQETFLAGFADKCIADQQAEADRVAAVESERRANGEHDKAAQELRDRLMAEATERINGEVAKLSADLAAKARAGV